MRFLFMAFHYPKPEYRAELLQWIERVGTALKAQPGLLELADFDDPEHGRIVAVSIWGSAEHFRLGRENAMNSLGEEAPYDIWEARPLEMFTLGELEDASS
jgi:heme-degrading monooxygenase HmoA